MKSLLLALAVGIPAAFILLILWAMWNGSPDPQDPHNSDV